MKLAAAIALALLAACASWTEPPAVAAVRRYLDARTHAEAVGRLAPQYRLWFGEKKGEGMSREAAAKMLEWDFALRPRHQIHSIEVHGDTVVVRQHEDNDFSRLIGFPGWDATSTYTVDEQGRITSQLYVPAEGQPAWRPYLDEPLVWIRANEPDVLERIFPNGRLAQSKDDAAQWVRVLTAWRAASRSAVAKPRL